MVWKSQIDTIYKLEKFKEGLAMSGKASIGLTAANKEVVEILRKKGWFEEQKDAGKFAMALSINRGVNSGEVEGVVPLWDIETFDSEGDVKSLIAALYPDEKQPYRFVEVLVNRGLEIIAQHLQENPAIDISDLWLK